MNKPSLIKNYIYSLSYQILALIIPLITTPYVSRILNAEGIGEYSYTFSISSYFTLLGCLGLALYGQLQIAKRRDNQKEISILFWEISIAKAILITISLFVYIVFVILFFQYKIMSFIMAINLFSSMLDISWFFAGIEDFKKTSIRNGIVKILTLILILILVKNKNDLYIYAIILQGSTLVGNFVLWPYLKPYLCKIDFKEIHPFRHILPCIPYFIPGIYSVIYSSVDKTMIGLLSTGLYSNGCYEQASKLQNFCAVIVGSFSAVVLPRVAYLNEKSEDKQKQKQLLRKSIWFSCTITVGMMFGLIGVANNFIPLYLGSGYDESIILLQLLSPIVVFSGLNNIVGHQCLMSGGKQDKYNLAVILGTIVNICLNYPLIVKYGAEGASVASVISELSILLMFMKYSRESISIKDILILMWRPFVAGIIMFFVISLIGNIKNGFNILVIQIFSGILIYILVLIILKDDILMTFINKFKIRRKYK